MAKLRQKISGGFRSERGAYNFARMRAVIATARKQGWNVIQTLVHPDPIQLIPLKGFQAYVEQHMTRPWRTATSAARPTTRPRRRTGARRSTRSCRSTARKQGWNVIQTLVHPDPIQLIPLKGFQAYVEQHMTRPWRTATSAARPTTRPRRRTGARRSTRSCRCRRSRVGVSSDRHWPLSSPQNA